MTRRAAEPGAGPTARPTTQTERREAMTDRKHKQDEARRRHEDVGWEEGAEAGAAAADETDAPQAIAGSRDDDLAERLAAERDDYLDHLRRLQAEFENYRKRVRRDADELRLRAGEDVVEALLPVVDNMGRALEAADRHEEGQLIAGLQLVAGQLLDALSAQGLEEVPASPGDAFDPTVHEAVMTQPSNDHDQGAVLKVLERGYLLHGRLLRPAKVVVAR
jgi:molecular chaperone GrpE